MSPTRYLFSCNFGFCFLSFRLGLCFTDNNTIFPDSDPQDTVMPYRDVWKTIFPNGDRWDFNVSNEYLINFDDYLIPPRWSDEVNTFTPISHNITTVHVSPNVNEMENKVPVETLGDTEKFGRSTTEVESSSSKNKEKSPVKRKREAYKHQDYYTRFSSVGRRYERSAEVIRDFKNLQPGLSNPRNMSEKDLESAIHSLGDELRWKELTDYPLKTYARYWAYVCDYFWKKSNPNDERFRGCFVSFLLCPDTRIRIRYPESNFQSTKLDLLGCKCFYYTKLYKRPHSVPAVFGVYNYTDNKYFIFKKVNGKYNYAVSDLITEVHLPAPIK